MTQPASTVRPRWPTTGSLQNLLVVDELPAWSSNRLKHLVRSPKRHLVDSSLLVGILGLDAASVMRDGDQLGRVLETFVTAQIRAEVALAGGLSRLHHLRQEQGRHEVDLLIETHGHSVVAIEIKASSASTPGDARHLSWLRDQIGDRFASGVVLPGRRRRQLALRATKLAGRGPGLLARRLFSQFGAAGCDP